MLELTADPAVKAQGVVIEAKLEKGQGPTATVLIQNGTLRRGDSVIAGHTHGKVKAMKDDKGAGVQKAGPASPVEILGLQDVPNAGDTLEVMEDDRAARQMAEERVDRQREEQLAASARVSLEDLYRQLKAGETKELLVVLRCDVDGSGEAIRHSLDELATEEVSVRVIQSAVGNVGENDVLLASASGAIVIGFNVKVDGQAKAAAERERVEIR